MPSDDLERRLDRALKQLPAPRAPHTLLPRVLAAVHAHVERPWYSRAWITWPVGWQMASVCALLALVVGSAMLIPLALTMLQATVSDAATGPLEDVAAIARRLRQAAEGAETTTTAAWIVWRVVFVPIVAYAVGVVALMCATCAAMGATLNHVVFGKASPR